MLLTIRATIVIFIPDDAVDPFDRPVKEHDEVSGFAVEAILEGRLGPDCDNVEIQELIEEQQEASE
jgi:hypothetical protein